METDTKRSHDLLTQLDHEIGAAANIVAAVERIWKIALACLLTILTGALWAARIQWQVNDLSEWKSGVSTEVRQHGATLEQFKGRFGLTSSPAPKPSASQPPSGPPAGLVWSPEEK